MQSYSGLLACLLLATAAVGRRSAHDIPARMLAFHAS